MFPCIPPLAGDLRAARTSETYHVDGEVRDRDPDNATLSVLYAGAAFLVGEVRSGRPRSTTRVLVISSSSTMRVSGSSSIPQRMRPPGQQGDYQGQETTNCNGLHSLSILHTALRILRGRHCSTAILSCTSRARCAKRREGPTMACMYRRRRRE